MPIYLCGAAQISAQQPLTDAWLTAPEALPESTLVRAIDPPFRSLLPAAESRRMGVALKRMAVVADSAMAEAAEIGALTLEKLEAMTCVCSVGLDMIAIPGDVPATSISGIIADEMAIGMVNQKTTAVRVIPVIGKGVGDRAQFGGLLGDAAIMPVNRYGCADFVNRGGRIPAPIHSFKN